ncbi:MAG: putative solute-binding protein [Myxococcota bacterium]
MRPFKTMLTTLAAAALFTLSVPAQAASVCVYDPAGRTGFAYKWMEAWQTQAAGWGANVELKSYNDEETAVKDFDAGTCDAIAATGIRLQKYNRATYTVEAVAGIPNYTLLKQVLVTLQTNDAYDRHFTSGQYETAGIYPLGAVYAFVRDRGINDAGDFAGRSVAYMDYDKTSLTVVEAIGAVKVPVNLSTLSSTFNNGRADATFVPASAYTPFELWKGLGDTGAVVKYPLLQVTMQVVLRKDSFPAGFGDKSRDYVARQFDTAMSVVNRSEGEIKSNYWMGMESSAKEQEFEQEMQKLRIKLRDTGRYDPEILTLLRKARCYADNTRWECAQNLE